MLQYEVSQQQDGGLCAQATGEVQPGLSRVEAASSAGCVNIMRM